MGDVNVSEHPWASLLDRLQSTGLRVASPLIALVLLCGCASASVRRLSAAAVGTDFVQPPGAYARETWSEGPILHVAYRVQEAFPAERTRALIQAELKRRGWTPRARGLAGEARPAGSDWTALDRELLGETSHVWSGYWEDTKHDVLAYWVAYRSRSLVEPHSDEVLEVTASYYPERQARQLEQEAHRQLEYLEGIWKTPEDR
jgi:hypothetical protein